MFLCVVAYDGKLKVRPLTVGVVATRKVPLAQRATALMVLRPNLEVSTVLQAVGVGLVGLKFLLVVRAQRATCAGLQVWMIAPLLIQLAKVFSVPGVGRL